MSRSFTLFLLVFVLIACSENKDSNQAQYNSPSEEGKLVNDSIPSEELTKNKTSKKDTLEAPAVFNRNGFDQALKYELLIEARICNPTYNDSIHDGTVPCSAKFFRFFEYNRKRSLKNAFMLQAKAGVNNYPYRRLLIFERERGKLILVNGITGYLVSQIKNESGFDDLIVAVIDDLGEDNFDRYDVLLRYKDGKYRIVEAIGDLQGKFESKKLKERATKMIKARINEKNLIF